MPASHSNSLGEDITHRLRLSTESIYRYYRAIPALPGLPPSPIVDKRRWCLYSAQSPILPNILNSTDNYADDAGEHSDGDGEHMNARPSYISLASSWRTSTSTLRNSDSSMGSSVLVRGVRPFEEEEEMSDANEATKMEESRVEDDIDDHVRQEREKALRILTSRADDVDDDEMAQSDAGGPIDGNGQGGKMTVTGLVSVRKEESELRENEFSGPLISYIQGNEGDLYKALIFNVRG